MDQIAALYLDTLKKTLIDYNRCDGYRYKPILRLKPYSVVRATKIDQRDRIFGQDWPEYAESMIGLKRMNNLQILIEKIIAEQVPGDILEAGVWRGGASIFMKANLIVHNSDKQLYVCDSFAGLPKPSLEQDTGDIHYKHDQLAVSLSEVMGNFAKYGLLLPGPATWFVEGLFKDTMPGLRTNTFSLLRLDGDMYESTMDVLTNLYDRLSVGGYCVIDDWCLPACRQAVQDFFSYSKVPDLVTIDYSSVYWKKA